jgi:DNA-binding NarL/FixJ family response regulator
MSTANSIRVFSVDDHPLLREGIATLIKSQPDMVLVSEAATGREAIQQFQKHQPDVTLMDLRLPDMNGIDVMIAIRTEFPNARIIKFTTLCSLHSKANRKSNVRLRPGLGAIR